jgi:hypothetical protein
MRCDRSPLNLPNVVHDENARAFDLNGVRRLVQLEPHPLRGFGLKTLAISIVAPKNARYGDVCRAERGNRKRCAPVASMKHEPHTGISEPSRKLGDRWNAVMRVREEANTH